MGGAPRPRWLGRAACLLVAVGATLRLRGECEDVAFTNCQPQRLRLWRRLMKRPAMPWDGLQVPNIFGGVAPAEDDDIKVPKSTEELVVALQDVMLSSVEKALPRMDVDLPPGVRIGIFGEQDPLVPPAGLSKEDIARADRELAAAYVEMFAGLKNDGALCVAFRTPKQAELAKKEWVDWGKSQIISMPNPKRSAGMKGGIGAKQQKLEDMARAPFLVAVNPSTSQLRELQKLDEQEEAAGSKRKCLVLLNARLRGREEPDRLRDELAAGSNAILHARFVGKDGFAFKTMVTPWTLSKRKMLLEMEDGTLKTEMEEVWRDNNEPSRDTLTQNFGSVV